MTKTVKVLEFSNNTDPTQQKENSSQNVKAKLKLDFYKKDRKVVVVEKSNAKETKKMNRKKRGGQFKYSESFILMAAILMTQYQLSYRRLEDHLVSHLGKSNVPHHSTLQDRITNLDVNILNTLQVQNFNKPIMIIIDSSGFKQHAGSNWIERKWKLKRDGYVKLHICIEAESQKILAYAVTTDKTSDTSKFKSLLTKSLKVIEECNDTNEPIIVTAAADKGYDSNKNHEFCKENNIQDLIIVKVNSKSHGDNARDIAVRTQLGGSPDCENVNELSTDERIENQDQWRIDSGYTYRGLVEGVFSTIKRLFGEHIKSIKWENIMREIDLLVLVYNLEMEKAP